MPVTQEQRDETPHDDFAGPSQSFPIRNQSDVDAAAHLIGHAADPDAVKRKAIAIAKRLGLTLPAAWQKKDTAKAMLDDDTLIWFGGDVKALGSGLVGGPVVQFGSPSTADRQGDYFTANTDYGLDVSTKSRVVYHHGMGKYGPKKFGVADLKADRYAIWAEAQLDMSDADAKALYEAVESGKIGWSSGSVERLVRRQDVKGTSEILSWPLIEVSLTPTPVDKRNKAVAIKAMMDGYGHPAHDAAMSAIDTLHYAMKAEMRGHMGDKAKDKKDRMACCKAVMNKHAYKCMKAVGALMDDDADMDDDSIKSLLAGLVAGPSLSERSEALVADAGELYGAFVKALEQRESEGRFLSPAKCAEVKAIAAQFDSLVAKLPDYDGSRRRRLLPLLRARAG